MDAAEINKGMGDNGLASDPAFYNLNFIIGRLPNIPPEEEGHVLGLYYPNGTPTIVLPRDADRSTLLHEVGHRYSHYYHDDLSEPSAEAFRKMHESRGRVFRSVPQGETFTCPDCGNSFLVYGDDVQCSQCFARYRRMA